MIIKRTKYLKKIKKYIDSEVVKVITGMRRCWKTYFMKQVIDHLITDRKVNRENIIYINKEDLRFDFIKDYSDLYLYIENQIKDKNW